MSSSENHTIPPLQPRFTTQFFEQYARITLIDILGNDFACLVNYDRPDLQDPNGTIGIEVTRAIAENRDSAKAFEEQIACVRNQQRAVRKYGYGYGILPGLMSEKEYSYWQTALSAKRILASKVRKVADGFYGHFDKYALYVFIKQEVEQADVEEMVAYVQELQEQNRRKFSVLYISHVTVLYVAHLPSGTMEVYPISHSKRKKYYKKAVRKQAKCT